MKLFDTVREKLGDVNIIAEDLGDIFDSVKKLLSDTGFPGMRVLQLRLQQRRQGQYSPVP